MSTAPRAAVVYLARKAEGLEPLERFASAYRRHPAGEDHDLVVIYKGFEPGDAELADAERAFADLHSRSLFIDDQGIDITAYLDAAERLEHDEICFLNTFSEPDDDHWLRKLLDNLRRDGVGIIGATGSYESLRSSMDLLSKVVWLCAARNIEWDERLARYYRWLLESQFPAWLTGARRPGLARRLVTAVAGPPDYRRHDRDYAVHWTAVTQPNAPIEWAPLFPEFPNPHIRSNCFAIQRRRLLSFDFPKIVTKMEGCRFESGYNSLTARVRQSGLAALVVGKDSVGYDVADWPASRTFRLGDQRNVLVTDNQVRNFKDYSAEERATHVLMTWGDYVDRAETEGVPALGKTFRRAAKTL
jgi:hypothetical protein